jgi:endonuclease/exonuclease/phosphatase (EEP) superfamily protein YafD
MDVTDATAAARGAALPARAASFVETLVSVGIVVLSLSAALAEAARLHWLAELFSHFRLQYATGLAVLALVLLALKRRPTALTAVAGVFMALAATHVVRATSGTAPRSVSTASSVKLLSFNVEGANDRLAEAAATILGARPDVVLILEWKPKHATGLAPSLVAAGLTPVVTMPRDDDFGIALFSRLPVLSSALRYWGGQLPPPSVLAELAVGERTLRIAGVHAVPPGPSGATARRDALLLDAASELARLDGPRVLAGDFNLTPWAPVFKDVLRLSGLADSRGQGLHLTWPGRAPLYPLFLIPIDHVLVSPDVSAARREELSPSGSDHFAVAVTLGL